MFGQFEACFSRKGTPSLTAQGAHRSSPNFVPAVKAAGFDVMSFASNHCMHFGAEGLLDTIEISKQIGIPLVGVGKDIHEARKPVIMECKGARITFLAYCSILPPGYWTTEDRPGCAPLRVNTFYESAVANQPGAPADVHTFAFKEDQQAMVEDIRKAKEIADVVVVSAHWGVPFAYATIDAYQREAAHAAIDAGARYRAWPARHTRQPCGAREYRHYATQSRMVCGNRRRPQYRAQTCGAAYPAFGSASGSGQRHAVSVNGSVLLRDR
jgi:poly-gamma-glutamate capsule biosynthesis protein CapA/YwtB (metallophosphatase superfamily)